MHRSPEVRTSDLSKELFVFILEVGRKDSLPHVIENLLTSPEATAVELVLARLDRSVVAAAVNVDELALPLAFEDIVAQRLGLEVGDPKLLANLTVQGLVYILT